MALNHYMAVAQLAKVSGNPKDTIENVFHFQGDSGPSDAADYASISAALIAFYTATPTGATDNVGAFMARSMSRTSNGNKIVIYSQPLAALGADMGSPKDVVSWTLGNVSGTAVDFPDEVAAVISIHGDLTDIPETEANPAPPPTVIRPAARRRGRVYIGALNGACGALDGNSEVLIGATFHNILNGMAVDLMSAGSGSAPEWCVYSRAINLLFPVVGGFLNYDFDTQRRRGTNVGTRTSF